MNTAPCVPHRSPFFTHIAFQPFRLHPPSVPVVAFPLFVNLALCFTLTIRRGMPKDGAQTFQRHARFLRLRSFLAGSPDRQAVSSSFSYGLVVRVPLLPTPPHSGAVTFRYTMLTPFWSGLAPL